MKTPFRIVVALCCALFGSSQSSFAATATINVAPLGVAAANQPVYSGQNPTALIDGNKTAGNVVHGQQLLDPGFAFTIDLQTNYSITDIKIYPRQGNIAPDRLSNFRVSLHEDDGAGGMGAEIWGVDKFTDGSNAGAGPGVVVDVPLPAATTGRWIEIRSLADPVPQYALQMSEVEVFASVDASQVNRAVGAKVTANGPLWGTLTAAAITDGSRGTFAHGDTGLTVGFGYTVDLGLEVAMDHINIFARQDCQDCVGRLSNYRLSVFKDNNGAPGDKVYSIDLHTDQSNPGLGGKDVIDATIDPAFAGVKGQWVKLEALDDPPGDYAMQIAELEVYGTLPDVVKLQIGAEPQDAATGPGLAATYRVGANALGGDNALITYQWQKDGVNIPGATSASYTTGPLVAGDAGAKYRVLVSYPGQTTLTSREATLNINWARGSVVTSNGPAYAGIFVPALTVDGDRSNNSIAHGDATLPTGFAYTYKLGGEVNMTGIDIFPRTDCCPDRLANFRVTVHSDNNGEIGDPVWSADFFTEEGSNAGANVVHVLPSMDPAGTMKGKWVRIQVLTDPVPSYALQITEVEVYGSLTVNTPVITINRQPGDFGVAPGRSSRISVDASVFNGDPALMTVAWKRNGVLIPGATGPSYTTDILQESDAGAKYRAVISYPGIPDVESNDATATLDYNYARGSAATTNQKLWVGIPDWTPAIMVDGDRGTYVHGDTGLLPGFAYFFNMGSEVTLSNMTIVPRQDNCCGQRLSEFRVSIHKDNNGQIGDQVWAADFYTDQMNPGMELVPITADMDPAGTFKGQWIKVQSVADQVADYSLQIAEVEAIGSIAQAPRINFTTAAGGALTLNWSGGTLESATSILGPWGAVTPAPTSPYSPPRSETVQFFRLKQ